MGRTLLLGLLAAGCCCPIGELDDSQSSAPAEPTGPAPAEVAPAEVAPPEVAPVEPAGPTWTAIGSGPVLAVAGLPPPTMGLAGRWEPIQLPWETWQTLLRSTQQISQGTRQCYQDLPQLGWDIDHRRQMPRSFRAGRARSLHQPAWWHVDPTTVILVVPYNACDANGGYGAAFYGPTAGGVQYGSHFREMSDNCEPVDAVGHTDDEVRVITGCVNGDEYTVRTASVQNAAIAMREERVPVPR